MKIEHVAMWVQNLESMKDFYVKYFQGIAGPVYHNPDKGFTSYFITFKSGARLELMHNDQITVASQYHKLGFTHLAFSVGKETEVDRITRYLEDEGVRVMGKPRKTGDGYYESIILDPEGNQIEITA